MVSIDDNSALLLYRVGPVLCCAPCLPVSGIITPPALTHPPGSHRGRPGIFKHANAIVSELDLRFQFGMDAADWSQPGRIIITAMNNHHIGFHVDAILDVIKMPASGWGGLPALLPRGVFSRTLLIKQQIYLYAEFDKLQDIPHSDYLCQYIQQLLAVTANNPDTPVAPVPETAITTTTDSPAPGGNNDAVTPAEYCANTTRSRHSVIQSKATATPRPHKTPATSAVHRLSGGSSPTINTHRRPALTPQGSTPARAKPPQRTPNTPPPAVAASIRPVSLSAQAHASPVTAPASARADAKPNDSLSPGSTTGPVRVQATPDHGKDWLVATLLLCLLVAVFGSAMWYLLDIETAADRTTSQTSAGRDLAATQDSITPPGITSQPTVPIAAAPHHTETQQATPTPLPDHTTLHTPAVSVAAANRTDTPTTPSPTSGHRETDRHHYHASIEKDAHGLTITVDVPASDPAFHQSTHSTPAHTTVTPPADNHADTKADKADTAVPATTNTTPPTPAGAAAPATRQTVVIIHIVVRGDTLWAIAKRYVQDPFRYPELARLSKIKNPDLIYPGDRVRIIKRIRQDK